MKLNPVKLSALKLYRVRLEINKQFGEEGVKVLALLQSNPDYDYIVSKSGVSKDRVDEILHRLVELGALENFEGSTPPAKPKEVSSTASSSVEKPQSPAIAKEVSPTPAVSPVKKPVSTAKSAAKVESKPKDDKPKEVDVKHRLYSLNPVGTLKRFRIQKMIFKQFSSRGLSVYDYLKGKQDVSYSDIVENTGLDEDVVSSILEFMLKNDIVSSKVLEGFEPEEVSEPVEESISEEQSSSPEPLSEQVEEPALPEKPSREEGLSPEEVIPPAEEESSPTEEFTPEPEGISPPSVSDEPTSLEVSNEGAPSEEQPLTPTESEEDLTPAPESEEPSSEIVPSEMEPAEELETPPKESGEVSQPVSSNRVVEGVKYRVKPLAMEEKFKVQQELLSQFGGNGLKVFSLLTVPSDLGHLLELSGLEKDVVEPILKHLLDKGVVLPEGAPAKPEAKGESSPSASEPSIEPVAKEEPSEDVSVLPEEGELTPADDIDLTTEKKEQSVEGIASPEEPGVEPPSVSEDLQPSEELSLSPETEPSEPEEAPLSPEPSESEELTTSLEEESSPEEEQSIAPEEGESESMEELTPSPESDELTPVDIEPESGEDLTPSAEEEDIESPLDFDESAEFSEESEEASGSESFEVEPVGIPVDTEDSEVSSAPEELDESEQLIYDNFGDKGLQVYRLIDGIKSTEEIMDEAGVDEDFILKFFDFLETHGIIRLDYKGDSGSSEDDFSYYEESSSVSKSVAVPLLENMTESKREVVIGDIIPIDVPIKKVLSLPARLSLEAKLMAKFGSRGVRVLNLIDSSKDVIQIALETGIPLDELDEILYSIGNSGGCEFATLSEDEIRERYGEQGLVMYKNYGRDGVLMYELVGRSKSLKEMVDFVKVDPHKAVDMIVRINQLLDLNEISREDLEKELGLL